MANLTGKGGFKDHPANRNKAGQRNHKAVAFTKTLRELIVKEGSQKQSTFIDEKRVTASKVEWLVKRLWSEALKGEAWAMTFIAERVEGKVKEELEQHGELVIRIERERGNADFADLASGPGANQI